MIEKLPRLSNFIDYHKYDVGYKCSIMTNGCYDNRVDYSPVTFNWFLTVYVDTVPTEVRLFCSYGNCNHYSMCIIRPCCRSGTHSSMRGVRCYSDMPLHCSSLTKNSSLNWTAIQLSSIKSAEWEN